MRSACMLLVAVVLLGGLLTRGVPAQEGVAERIGEKLDETARKVGGGLRQGWAEVRGSVNSLSVQGRVYGRLYWDKDLNQSAIEISVHDGGKVTLKGSVPDEAAKSKAGQLTVDTVGVNEVVNELAIAPASAE